jgi:putative methionine-R-sulfoxide reductase with GAF domain
MQDEDKTVIQTLYVFVIFALLGSILISVSALITSQGVFTAFVLSGLVGVITCLVVLWLLSIKQFFIPRLLLPSVVYLLATYLIFTGATVGVRDDAILLYSLVVAMAGLLLGKRGVVIFGILSVIAVAGSVYAEVNGILINHISSKTTTYNTLVNVVVIYSLTFAMMYILVNIFTANLAKMRSNQHELTQVNQELWSIRESLEQQVMERTRAAEFARAEAESARREAESQAWFTRGQAQLAEQMRGELNLPTLANNITSHLSQYIGAQTGALFVASDDFLKLMGRYAYMECAGKKREFRFGENLIGEAANAKRMILVDDIPADAPLVSSALGESIPRQILIVPLESNGQVLGVIEFATLTKFTPDHASFLNRVSESIAIALQTAQSRL